MKIPKLKKWQIVQIWWIDSCHLSGWRREGEIDFSKSDLDHTTVGYFLKQTPYSISVVQSKKDTENNPSVDALMEIPLIAITKVKIIK